MPWTRLTQMVGAMLASAALGAQQPARAPMTDPRDAHPLPSAPVLTTAICGAGTFALFLDGRRVGQETFDIECVPAGGFAGKGRTQFSAGGLTVDVSTTIDVDREGRPRTTTASGSAQGTTLDQALRFDDGTGRLTSGGTTSEVPYAPDAAYLPSNIFYQVQFFLARYDALRGGVQQIPVFPNVRVALEFRGTDRARVPRSPGRVLAAREARFDRYELSLPVRNVIWTDSLGRVAVVSVPSQRFVAAREEYVPFVDPLHVALARADESLAKAMKPPDYGAPASAPYTAEEVTVTAAGYSLAGTLLLPRSASRPLPAAILVTGSGQQTRDQPLGIPGLERYRPFRQIAEALGAAGIAVLRVDDRGVGGSTGRETLERATTSGFAEDVRAHVSYLRARGEIDGDRIAIIGHSEGGTIATMVAATDPRVAAIVLIAAVAKRGDAVLADQLGDILERSGLSAQQQEAARAQQRQTFASLRSGQSVSGLSGAAWWREFIDYDPLADVRRVRQPILILHGGLDRQVTVEQAGMLERAAREAGNRDVTVRTFPRLNHLLLEATTGAVSEYSSLPSAELGDEVLHAIRDWVRARLRAQP